MSAHGRRPDVGGSRSGAGLDNNRTTPACAAEVRRPLRGRSVGVRPGSRHRVARRRGDLERRSGGACPASELVGSEVRLESIPPPSDKDAYRAPRETKADIRAHFGLAEDEPLPDLSVFPLRKLADLIRYVTPVGSLVDAYPVHLITRASLAAMAALTPGSDFDVRRFRPNLVVDTEPGDGLPENSWCNADLEPAERSSARRDP